MTVQILSWNVMLRRYEEQYNPKSVRLLRYPNELDRLEAIVGKIREAINPKTIVCLQEGCKQLVEMLQIVLGNSHTVFSHYQRVPPTAGAEECLITLVPIGMGFSVEHRDKCSLTVANRLYRIANCHLTPQKFSKDNTFRWMGLLPKDRLTVIAGDFNSRYTDVITSTHLKRYVIPYFGKTYKSTQLDYIIFNVQTEFTPMICRAKNVSDHNMIMTEITM